MERHLIICDNLATFAPSSAAVDLATEMNSACDVHFVSAIPDQSRNKAQDVKLDCNMHRFRMTNRWGYTNSLEFRSLISNIGPNTVHLFSERPFAWLPLMSLSRIKRVKIHLQHRLNESLKFANIVHRLSFLPGIEWTATSSEIAQDLLNRGVSRQNIEVLTPTLTAEARGYMAGECADSKASILQTFGGSHPIKLISVVAMLNAESRLQDLIWGCELIKAIRDDVHLAVIGDCVAGDQTYLRELQSFIRKTLLHKQVHFLGWSERAAHLIAGSDVYCEPSSWIPSSKALLFARCVGVPTAIAATPHNRHHFKDEQDCLMFPSNSKNEIGRRLYRLLNERQLATAISERARQSFDEKSNLDVDDALNKRPISAA